MQDIFSCCSNAAQAIKMKKKTTMQIEHVEIKH